MSGLSDYCGESSSDVTTSSRVMCSRHERVDTREVLSGAPACFSVVIAIAHREQSYDRWRRVYRTHDSRVVAMACAVEGMENKKEIASTNATNN